MRTADLLKPALKMIGRHLHSAVGRRVVILCYHSVHPSLSYRSATPGLFEQHLSWLRENCDVVPFSEVLAARDDGARSRPVVSLTFDDGYADNHEFALPLLVRFGIKATFFITAGFIGRDPAVLARFRALRGVAHEVEPLAWTQASEMLEAGMEIGAHTYSHPNLVRLTDRELGFELAHSKKMLEDHINRRITMMAYPFGRPKVHVDARVARAVRNSGYALAGTTATRGLTRRDSALTVPRFFATNDAVAVVREKVYGDWDLIGTVRERAPIIVARIVSPKDFSF
jgi:peptidoglycan/xylan/chitin deacetylase (PgdA/CDA1 family)